MPADIATLVRKYNLPDVAVLEFEAAAAHRSVAATVVGYDSVDLEPDDLPMGEAAEIADRYIDLGPLGAGGMGEVRRVRDRELNRTLAMKIVHPNVVRHPSMIARFLDEAQASAQLQHPNIVPVHDLGRLPDGRLWFTMREVRGRTLGDVIAEVHAASNERWETGAQGWTFRRVLTAFLAVCNAVAYAHERGVVHRDLKPDNTMVGERGEVYVLDWGLAKIVGRPDRAAEAGELDVVRTERSEKDEYRTKMGQVAGTPAYMPPEHARGEVDQIDARSDVYALGAILYEILSGRPPYEGQALAREPGDRFSTATALAEEVQAWLDGSRRREQALEVIATSLLGDEEARALEDKARALRSEAEELLKDVSPWAPEEDKALGWAKQDEAERLKRAAKRRYYAVRIGLEGSLQIAPDLPEAHAILAERFKQRHAETEVLRLVENVETWEWRLRTHSQALPPTHPVRHSIVTYLKGDGALSLVTDPPGAEALLFKYVERNRRLVEVFDRSLGVTPLREVPLPMGSYLCLIRHSQCDDVRYPVEITRNGHWDGVPPTGGTFPVLLPWRGELAANDVYVPAGWFQAGGDAKTSNGLPATRCWMPSFVIQRFPVVKGRLN